MEIKNDSGQYDIEYKVSPCVWGKEPAKYVRKVPDYLSKGIALDLGAGEGKNAVYLAKHGFDVTAIDISVYAMRNFLNWLIEDKTDYGITLIKGDILKYPFSNEYDLIVAYGLLHNLPSREDILVLIRKMQQYTCSGGINVVATLTNELPIPEEQHYLDSILLEPFELRDIFYSEWEMLDYETGRIVEKHPSNNLVHEHSICRMIARKPSP